MAEFLAIKTETKISGLSLDFFIMARMVNFCEVFFLCVIVGNLITY